MTRFILFIAGLALLAPSLTLAEQPLHQCPEQFRFYGVNDIQETESGNVQILARAGLFRFGNLMQSEIYARTEYNHTHLKMFRDPSERDSFLTLAQLDRESRNGFALFRFTGKEHELVAHLEGRLREPTYFQRGKEGIFIASRAGKIYRWHPDTGLKQTHVEEKLTIPNLSKPYRAIQFAAAKDGPVCCYSIADPRYHKKALFDVLVSGEKKGDPAWRRIPLKTEDGKQRFTGPAFMPDRDTLRMLFYNRWLNIDLKTGKLTEEPFQKPGDAETKIKPTKVFQTPDGTVISLWRKLYRSPKPDDIDRFENGKYFRIAEWKGGRWEWASVGLDRFVRKDHPHTFDSQGGLWIVSGMGGFVYRSPKGEYREFGHQHGIANLWAQSIHMTQDWVWTISNRNVNRYSTEKLRNSNPDEIATRKFGSWVVHDSQSPISNHFQQRPFRLHPLITLEGKIKLIHPANAEEELIDLPQTDDLTMSPDNLDARSDSRGDIWVTSRGVLQFGAKPLREGMFADVFRYKDGKWERFRESSEGNVRLTPIEMAARALIKEGFHDGDFAPQMAFGAGKGGGKVAIRCEDRLAYFNGKEWNDALVPNFGANYPLFIGNDVILSSNTKLAWRLPQSVLDEPSDDGKYPWERSLINDRNQGAEIMKTIALKRTIAYSHNQGQLLAMGDKKLALYHRGHWSVVPDPEPPFPANSPNRKAIQMFGVADDGTIVAQISHNPTWSYAVRAGSPVTITQGDKDLGQVDDLEGTLEPRFDTSLDSDDALVRYRIDGGPWSDWSSATSKIKPGLLVGKRHELEIQIGSHTAIVRNPGLTYEFRVGYDGDAQFAEMTKQLASPRFEEREKAQAKLIETGQQLRTALNQTVKNTDDAEVKTRIATILEKLPKPQVLVD